MATRAAARIPYGVGRLSGGWWVLVLILAAFVALGVYAYSRQLAEGEVVTGMRDIGTGGGAAWGLYIAFVVYFVGVSFAGITIAALIRLLNLERLKPIARMAEVLTVIALILGSFSILVDLGQPARGIVNLLRYARPQSPFFGTFSLVISGYLFASLIYLYLDGRKDARLCAQRPGRLQWFYRMWAAGYGDTPGERARHSHVSWWLALSILPMLVVAHSTLGFIFGIQPGRPGWFSALQAPGFVVLAGVSGFGLLIVIGAILRRVSGVREHLNIDVFRWLGNFLLVLTLVYLYFLAVELLTTRYIGHAHELAVSDAMIKGEYAWLFWGTVGCLVVAAGLLLFQVAAHRYSLSVIVIAGVLVNLAAIGKRDVIIVPSQTHGTVLPYLSGTYTPSWVEYSVILGLIALGTLLYVIFLKVFPIMEVPETAKGGK